MFSCIFRKYLCQNQYSIKIVRFDNIDVIYVTLTYSKFPLFNCRHFRRACTFKGMHEVANENSHENCIKIPTVAI